MLTFALLLAGPCAMAQGSSDETAPADPPVTVTVTPDASATDAGASKDVARRAHLDGLFARLSDPEADDWHRVQAQIWSAWSESGSPSMNLLLSRAAKAMESHAFDVALIHLNDLVRLAPDFAEGWNKRATVHFLRDDYGRSVADIERVLTLEPRHFGALSGLGIILDRIGKKEAALEAYRAAHEIHPHLEGADKAIEKLSKDVEGRAL